jgi:hypothetical protein
MVQFTRSSPTFSCFVTQFLTPSATLALPRYVDLVKVKGSTSATGDLVEATVEERDIQVASKAN